MFKHPSQFVRDAGGRLRERAEQRNGSLEAQPGARSETGLDRLSPSGAGPFREKRTVRGRRPRIEIVLCRLAIDLTVLIHFLFILFVIFGALVAWRWPAWKWPHWVAMGYGLLIEVFNWYCPLTLLENHLRRIGGLRAYDESFITLHLKRLIYVDVSQAVLIAGAVLVILLNAAFYIQMSRRKSRA